MEPVSSSSISNNCANPQSSSCIQWDGPDLSCIGLCKGATITDVMYKEALKICALLELTDLTGLDLSCLCGPSTVPCCPAGSNLVQLSDGTYGCQDIETKIIGRTIPCPDNNPCPTDLTFKNILQLIINKLCNCCP